ncbi:BRCT domain-containing protein [Ottowia sp. VDI28]|uniref:BRCT domain-containing protein n=1 Tax=Ottowia sp. VDI28 TaxID=3133968 RepID=UPI003C2EB4A0
MTENPSIKRTLDTRKRTRAYQVLEGIVTGIVADGHLHDMEVSMLRTWLAENAEVASTWPGSAIAKLIDDSLADGILDADERTHLLVTLQGLVGSDFSESGATTPDVAALPFDNGLAVDLRACGVCHTGEFLYGTRAACERLTEKMGGLPLSTISKKVSYLVVGTHVSPDWVTQSYGRKIMQAMELKGKGHGLAIIPERGWLAAAECL